MSGTQTPPPSFRQWISSLGLRIFPFGGELRHYNRHKLRDDAMAATDVALLAFPQSLAFAAIAGIPLQYGLMGTAVAAIASIFFANSRFIMPGPTNATALLLFTTFASLGLPPEMHATYVPVIIVFVGFLLFAGAFLNVATALQFVSRTVVSGYITAASIYIVANQLPHALGLTLDLGHGATVLQMLAALTRGIREVDGNALAVSVAALAAFLTLEKRFPRLPNIAIALVIATGIAFALERINPVDHDLFEKLRPVTRAELVPTGADISLERLAEVSGSAMIIAFLCMLEAVSIGKALAARAGERLNVNQEILSLGMSNLACGVLNGMPASGSLTRSQVAVESGARTAFCNFIAGVLCLGGVFALGPFIGSIPRCALAMLVTWKGIALIQPKSLRIVLRSTREDTWVFWITLATALLLRLDVAIVVGVVWSIVLFLRKAARPDLIEYTFNEQGALSERTAQDQASVQPEVSIVHVEGDLFFGAAELFGNQIRRVSEEPNLRVLVLKLRNTRNIDATAILALEDLLKVMRKRSRHLLLTELRDPNLSTLRRSGLVHDLGEENVFPDEPANPTLSTAKALRRAMKLIGATDARVTVFAETPHKNGGN